MPITPASQEVELEGSWFEAILGKNQSDPTFKKENKLAN
jgi:hypothetical protein